MEKGNAASTSGIWYANGPKWIKGVVERITGPVSYGISARGYIVRRHVDQLRLRVDDENPAEVIRKHGTRESPNEDNREERMEHSFREVLDNPLMNSAENTETVSVEQDPISDGNSRELESTVADRPPHTPDIVTRTPTSNEPVRRSSRARKQTQFYGFD